MNLPAKVMGGADEFSAPFSLKKAFGRKYRVLMEESWGVERAESKKGQEAWCEIIPCKAFKPGPPQEGPFIGLFSDGDPPTLQLLTTRVGNAKSIWGRIKDQPGCQADFHMDGEVMLYFPASLLPLVAEMAGVRKRRQLSEEHRQKLVAAGKVGREALKEWKKQRLQSQNLGRNEAPGP